VRLVILSENLGTSPPTPERRTSVSSRNTPDINAFPPLTGFKDSRKAGNERMYFKTQARRQEAAADRLSYCIMCDGSREDWCGLEIYDAATRQERGL
jgi:hypothetical protein